MCVPILVPLFKMQPPYSSQFSCKNATPSSGASQLVSYKEVPFPPPPPPGILASDQRTSLYFRATFELLSLQKATFACFYEQILSNSFWNYGKAYGKSRATCGKPYKYLYPAECLLRCHGSCDCCESLDKPISNIKIHTWQRLKGILKMKSHQDSEIKWFMSQVGIFSSSLATRSIDLAIKRFAKTPWTLKHKIVCSWLDAICIEYINEALTGTGAFSTIFVTFTFVLATQLVVTLNHILAIASFVFAICWYLEDRENERLGDKTLA